MPGDVRRFTDAEVNRLVKFYEQAEREILKQLNRALLRGNKTEYLAAMKKNIEAILEQLREGNRTWCTEAIPRVYSDSLRSADMMIRDAGLGVKAGFAAIHQQAAQVLAENAFQRYEDVTQVIGRQVEDIYRSLALENIRGTVVGYDTWKETAKRYREQLAERGVTGFKDRAGRMWNMRTYTEMAARTTAMQAHLEGTANRLAEQGHDLIEISSHVGACKLCLPWENKVLSLTGKTPGYPTLEEAKAAGLFHVNCRHAYGLYIDLDKEIERLEAEARDTKEVGTAQTIQEIKDSIAEKGYIGEKDVYQAGEMLYNDLRGKREGLKKEIKRLEKEYKDSGIEEIENRLSKLRQARRSLVDLDEIGLSSRDELYLEYDKLMKSRFKIQSKVSEIQNKLRVVKEKYRGTSVDNAAELKEKLSEIREVGISSFDIDGHLNKSRSPMRKVVKEAYDYYPTDWVEKSVHTGNLTPKKAKRGHYNHYKEEIAVSGYSDDSYFSTAIHELGHRFEKTVPGLLEAEKKFYRKRTAGENLEWLGPGYRKDELTRKDKFINKYMGKDYGGTAYELVSMGFEYAYTNPTSLWQDEEYAKWIYGILFLY